MNVETGELCLATADGDDNARSSSTCIQCELCLREFADTDILFHVQQEHAQHSRAETVSGVCDAKYHTPMFGTKRKKNETKIDIRSVPCFTVYREVSRAARRASSDYCDETAR